MCEHRFQKDHDSPPVSFRPRFNRESVPSLCSIHFSRIGYLKSRGDYRGFKFSYPGERDGRSEIQFNRVTVTLSSFLWLIIVQLFTASERQALPSSSFIPTDPYYSVCFCWFLRGIILVCAFERPTI